MQSPTPPAPYSFAALLVDLDGHVIGLNPGRPIQQDDAGMAVTLVHVFRRLGSLLGNGEVEMVFVDAVDGRVALLPLRAHDLAVALVVPSHIKTSAVRERRARLQELLCGLLPPSAASVSVLRLSSVTREEIIAVLASLLADFGCPDESLEEDACRRALTSLVHQCCAGASTAATARCLASLCQEAGIPRVDRLLGTGAFGTVYGLEDGSVLKITRDADEARATAALVDRRLRRFPAVVRVVRWTVLGRATGCFGIVREAVDDAGCLSGSLGAAAARACDMLIAMRTGDDVREPLSIPEREVALPFAREVDAELRAHGILFGDYHLRNVGLLRGRLCFFDLSLASGPPVDLEVIDLGVPGTCTERYRSPPVRSASDR